MKVDHSPKGYLSKPILFIVMSAMSLWDCTTASSKTLSRVGENHKLVQTRHGLFLINELDSYIGRSLDYYGEWSEGEVSLFSKIIEKGEFVLDIGANIGSFTVPLSKLVGVEGKVHAFEAQRVLSQILAANIALNELHNIHIHHSVVGDGKDDISVRKINYGYKANYVAVSLVDKNWKEIGGVESVPQQQLDDMFYVAGEECPSFIKIDVEGMELKVLRGGMKLITECQPWLYVENNCIKDSKDLITFIAGMGYVCHWDVNSYYNTLNYEQNQTSVFPDAAFSINMICYDENKDISAIKESFPDITKIDPVNERFELHEYNLAMAGNAKLVLKQFGTNEKCVR